MLALFSFLIVVLFSLIVVKVGAIMLEATGLSDEIAEFQSQSAFSGVGFTTSESETIMHNPVRRKILRTLMLLGSAGLTSAVATLILTFMQATGKMNIFNIGVSRFAVTISSLIIGLIIFLLIIRTKWFDKSLRRFMQKPLHKLKTHVALYDYEHLMGLSMGFSIISFEVPRWHWLVNKTIRRLKLEKEGIIILGLFRNIKKKEQYIGMPEDEFKIKHNDKIIIYGRDSTVTNLTKREKGIRGKVDREQAEKLQKNIKKIDEIEQQQILTKK